MDAPVSRARRAAFLSLPSLLFLAVLAGTEAAARTWLAPVDSLDFLVTAPRQQAMFHDRNQVRIFTGDPLLFWRLRPNLDRVIWDGTLVSTNAQGLRYPARVGPKTAGAVRVLCLGDSVTFGYRVPRVFPRRSDANPEWLPYPQLLERALRAANPGRSVEVVPLAVPGYSSHQGLAWARRDLKDLQPDLVIACFGWNDIDRRGMSDAAAMKMDRARVAARRLILHSQGLMHFARFLGSLGRDEAPGRPAEVMRVPREAYVANLLEIARLAGEQGSRTVIVGPVYRDRVAHPPEGDDIAGHRAALRQACAAKSVAYMEVPALTEAGSPANQSLFEEHIHPNHRGHRLLAEALLAFLADRRLLPGLTVPLPPRSSSPLPTGERG